MKKLLYICAALVAVSCVKESALEVESVTGKVPVTVEFAETKTVISGNQISFSGVETMSLICKDVNAAKISNDGFAVGTFTGEFDAVGQSKSDASFYAIYPYVGVGQNGQERCFLPLNQRAPFDAAANFMCSDIVTAAYDESAMPTLSMSMNQLLGIVKVSFTNSALEYQNDLVKEVVLTSSTPLAGEFVVKFDEAGRPYPEFRGTDRRVLSWFATPVELGLDKVHEVHFFVNPAEIKDAVITVRTDKHEFSRQAQGSFTAKQGDLTYMDPMDLATTFRADEAQVKTLVVWGDSYTNRGYDTTHIDRCNYAYHLQQMLGSGWKIYNGGCSGDVTNTIAARQGGLGMHIGATEFTIPADCTPVDVGGVYSNRNYAFEENTFKQIARYGLINPCEIIVEDAAGNEIARIEGNITHKGTETNKTADFATDVKFTRTSPGEAITVPAKSKLVTFAAKNLRNPDLMIVYMGQNGGFTTLDILYQQLRSMIDYAFPEGPEDYIILGFHNHETVQKWNVDNAYWDFFGGAAGFGVNVAEDRPVSRFVNLYTELTGDNYKDYLVMSGAAASVEDICAEDIDYVSRGMIPYSYWIRPHIDDIHPNEYGARAFAHAVYKKIVELGYLD